MEDSESDTLNHAASDHSEAQGVQDPVDLSDAGGRGYEERRFYLRDTMLTSSCHRSDNQVYVPYTRNDALVDRPCI